jgi:hypothetical protein
MRDPEARSMKRALSVLFVFHCVTDLAFWQAHFKLGETVTAVHSGEREIQGCQSTSDEKVKPKNYESGGHDESS